MKRTVAVVLFVVVASRVSAADPVDVREIIKFHADWRDRMAGPAAAANKSTANAEEMALISQLAQQREREMQKQFPYATPVRVTARVRVVGRMPENPSTEQRYEIEMAFDDHALLPQGEPSFRCQTTDAELVARVKVGETVTLQGRLMFVHGGGLSFVRGKRVDHSMLLTIGDCVEVPKK